MKIFEADGTNDLMHPVYNYIAQNGLSQGSRNGPVLQCVGPVALIHNKPNQHVNFCPIRNANPVFHLMESLAILAGYNDVAWLSQFNANMVNFSDDGEIFNAFYGTRIKRTWDDQLAGVISVLTDDPRSRQAVINIWNPEDLTKDTKDKACNLSVVFSIDPLSGAKLDMVVYNRSNDAIWGTVSGANEVQFPMIMMYVAESLDLELGVYTHVTNNLHVYEGPQWDLLKDAYDSQRYKGFNYPNRWGYTLFDYETGKDGFDNDLDTFFSLTKRGIPNSIPSLASFSTQFFKKVAYPIFLAYRDYRMCVPGRMFYTFPAGDNPWCVATRIWLQRAIERREGSAL